jgi:hypothetical protein
MDLTLLGAYVGVALLSGFKFLPGVALSLGLGFNWWERALSTGLGGVLGVVVFTYFGEALGKLWAKYRRRRKLKAKEQQDGPAKPTMAQRLWHRFGLWGVTILVPFLMPAVATAIALSFGTPRGRILRFMVPSILLWALVFAWTGDSLLALARIWGLLPAGG